MKKFKVVILETVTQKTVKTIEAEDLSDARQGAFDCNYELDTKEHKEKVIPFSQEVIDREVFEIEETT